MECLRCGLQLWDPPMAGSAEWYDQSDHYLTAPFVGWLGWYHSQALGDLPSSAGTLLDIGCGDGRFVHAAADRGIDAYGIDHSERLIRIGNTRRNDGRLSRTSIEEFRATGRRFGVVTMFEVIEHVEQPLELLRLAASVLRPRGTIVVSTPNRLGYPWGKHAMDRPPHHLTRWTSATLNDALARAGFVGIDIRLSPGEVGLRSYLMDHMSSGIMVRVLRRRRTRSASADPDVPFSVRSAIVAKDRVLRGISRLVSPIVGRRFAGGSMVAYARLP